MHAMQRQAHLGMLSLVVALAIVATGCASGTAGSGDKAGGPGEPVVLRMATINGDLAFAPQIPHLVDRVKELSAGNLKIEIEYEVGNFAADAEQQVVRGVASGKFDLGYASTHVFDTLGVSSLKALTAPMLIDSYALERAVFESGITDQMMRGLDGAGVTGLGILAGAMRKPIAVDGHLTGAADWKGITFGTFRSETQEEAIRALAASPMQGDRDEALEKGSIDGFESSLLAYQQNGQEQPAPHATTNVNLWPQTLAVVGNPDLVADLTAEQSAWLQRAADDAASRSVAIADTEARDIGIACDAGARFADASEANLISLREAFAPVYASLQQNPETKSYIEQIEELKQSTTPEPAPAIPTGCSGKAPAQPTASEGSTPAYLNGVYRYTITKEDRIEAGDPDPPTTNTVTLRDGTFSLKGTHGGFSGTYAVENDKITFEPLDVNYVSTFTFSVDDDGDLHLKPVQPMDPGGAFEMSVHPWTKIR